MDLVFLMFAAGSIFGWIIEKLYRSRLFGKWSKVGLLYGCYLPIYGFGAAIAYLLSILDINLPSKILLIIITPTVLEFIGGIIFVIQYKIDLWDYSKERYNYRGIICLKYSTILGSLSIAASYFISKYTSNLRELTDYPIIQYIAGGVIIIMMIDTFFTFKNKIFVKLKEVAEEGKKIVEDGKKAIDNGKKALEEQKKRFETDGKKLIKKIKIKN